MCDIEKEWHGDVVEVDEDPELLGKFPREQNQCQFKDHLVQENILKIEKVFQVRENTAKIRDRFLGCDT